MEGSRHVELVVSRPFQAGAFRFCVASPTPALNTLIEQLFSDLPRPAADQLSTLIVTPSTVRSEGERYDVHAPQIGTMTSLSLPAVVTMLVAAVNLSVLAAEPERLHLHAAGAVRSGRAAIICAPRQTGKTTTLVHLVGRGWDFISDESLSIAPGETVVRGFAKPLSIKPTGRHLVPSLVHALLPKSRVADDALHVSLGTVGATIRSEAEPHLLILLRRDPSAADEPPRSHRVHPADAVVRLMGETFDAGRFGPGAALELARLATRCLCHEVTVGPPAETAHLIERLFDEPAITPLPLTELTDGTRIEPNVVSFLVGDRVVIHEQPEGRILALDPAASQIWLELGDWETSEPVELSGPVVSQFVDQLVALGLVRAGDAGIPAP